jgi:hypothetical protein
MRKLCVPLVLFLAISMAGCDKVKAICNLLMSVADQVQADATTAYNSGTMPLKTYDELLQVCNAARQAKGQIDLVLAETEKLDRDSKTKIYAILDAVARGIAPEKLTCINDIGDEKVRTALFRVIGSLRTGLIATGIVLLFA